MSGANARPIGRSHQEILTRRHFLGHAGIGIGAVALAEHLAELSPIDDVRATAIYRNQAVLTLVGRALDACVGDR